MLPAARVLMGLGHGWTGTKLTGGICSWLLHHHQGSSHLEFRSCYTLLDQQEVLSPLSTSFPPLERQSSYYPLTELGLIRK